MSIASEITRLQGVKSGILQAISDKGVTVPSDSALDDCPGLIGDIPSGGGIEGVLIGYTMPLNSEGQDGDFYIQINSYTKTDVNLGTIIPIQSGGDNCFSNDQGFDGGYAWKLFNNDLSDYWSSSLSPQFPVYAGYDFGIGNEKKINGVSIYPRVYNNNTQIKSFEVVAGNTIGNWEILMQATAPNSSSEQWLNYVIKNDNYYRYYALNALSTNGATVTIHELNLTDLAPAPANYENMSVTDIYKKVSGSWVVQ